MQRHDLDNANLGAVLKTALDAVVVMRLDGTVAGWNDVAERIFGWSYEDAFGHRMSELIIPLALRSAHEQGLAHYLATGEGPVLDRHFEITAVHRDGHAFPVELSITRTEQFGEPVFLGFIRDISERHEAARRQDLMIGELNHRVKNLLGVVAGIAHQTMRSSTTLAQFSEAFGGRLVALGRAHEVLTEAVWERASLRALVNELFGGQLGMARPQMRASGPDVFLEPRALLSVSMILHELATNAVKYGALSRAEGRVALNWLVDDARLSLAWIESGMSNVETPMTEGFGSKMIARTASHELRGDIVRKWTIDGLHFHLGFSVVGDD